MEKEKKAGGLYTTEGTENNCRERHGHSHADRFKYFIMENKLCSDVSLIVGKDKEIIRAHKVFLVAGSPEFEKVFMQNTSLTEFSIPHVEPLEFKALLEFLYTGKTSDVMYESVPLFNLANIYKVPDLVLACTKKLKNSLTCENIFKVFKLSVEFDNKCLEESTIQFLCKFGYFFLDDPRFLDLSQEDLAKLISRDDLVVDDEMQVFKTLLKWARCECERRFIPHSEVTDQHLRSILEKLIPFVRFPLMGAVEFYTNVSNTDILTMEEKVSLLSYSNVRNAKMSRMGSDLPTVLFNTKSRSIRIRKTVIIERLSTFNSNKMLEPKNLWHRICFKLNVDDAWIKSIGLNRIVDSKATSTSAPETFKVKIRLEDFDMTTLHAENTINVKAKENEKDHFQLPFDQPLPITKDIWYMISLKVESTGMRGRCYFGTCWSAVNNFVEYTTEAEPIQKHVKVEFKNPKDYEDGCETNESGGQIATLGFQF